MPPYQVHKPHLAILCIHKRIISVVYKFDRLNQITDPDRNDPLVHVSAFQATFQILINPMWSADPKNYQFYCAIFHEKWKMLNVQTCYLHYFVAFIVFFLEYIYLLLSPSINGPCHAKTYLRAYAESESPDQPAHPFSLIRIYTVR